MKPPKVIYVNVPAEGEPYAFGTAREAKEGRFKEDVLVAVPYVPAPAKPKRKKR